MIDTSKEKNNFLANAAKIKASTPLAGQPDWLLNLREANWQRFSQEGLPTVKDEEWKYTNLSDLNQFAFIKQDNGQLKELESYKQYCQDDQIILTFINGKYAKEHSRLNGLPKGVTISPLPEAVKNNAPQIQKVNDLFKGQPTPSLVALNCALHENGAFVHIPDNVVIKDTIHIVHVTSASNGEALSLPRTIISLGVSAQANILESHVSFNDEIVYFSNTLTDICLAENAVLRYTHAQKESRKAYHVSNTRAWVDRNANFEGFTLTAGAALTRNNLDIVLDGEGSNGTLNGLYSTYGTQHVDNHTCVEHKKPNCTSNQFYKGILNGASRSVFNGKIFVRSAAQKTNSYQLNKNLLLGKDCRVDTKPQLEIFADDVKCTHGATIGQLNEDEIFYLQTRCITRPEAIKMLAKGFVDDLLNTIKSPGVADKMRLLLAPSFKQL